MVAPIAATKPFSTTPRPGEPDASVASRALCQSVSQRMEPQGSAWLGRGKRLLWPRIMACNTAPMLWFETALLPDGWARHVRIQTADGQVVRIETGISPSGGDERHKIAIPGLPNVHSHAFQRGMAGLAERRGPADDNFWTWREVMYLFLDRLTPDDVAAIAGLAYAEMLERGFTRVGEFHYLHRDASGDAYSDVAAMANAIAIAAADTGIGLTLLPVFYAHGNFGAAPPAPGQRRFLSDIDSFTKLFDGCRRAISALQDARIGVAPHSLRAVTPAELSEIVPLSDGGPVHIHAAEELRSLEYAQRLTRGARNLWASAAQNSTGRALFEGALAGGAQSLGDLPFGLRTGASADFISLDANDPALAGRSGDAIL